MPPARAAIPRFFLYGEPPRDADERFSRRDGRGSQPSLRMAVSSAPMRTATSTSYWSYSPAAARCRPRRRATPSRPLPCSSRPLALRTGFAFAPETEGYVVTLADSLLRDLAREEAAFKRLFLAPTCASLAADPAHTREPPTRCRSSVASWFQGARQRRGRCRTASDGVGQRGARLARAGRLSFRSDQRTRRARRALSREGRAAPAHGSRSRSTRRR